jgi:hypothetical protein
MKGGSGSPRKVVACRMEHAGPSESLDEKLVANGVRLGNNRGHQGGFAMGIFRKLSGLFTGSLQDRSLWIAVQCDRCGEIIRTRVDLNNELSAEYGEGEGETAYYSRKVLVGKEGCYLPIEVELRFDAHRDLVEKRVKGGKFREG